MMRSFGIAAVGCFFRATMNRTRADGELADEMPKAAKLCNTSDEQQMEKFLI